MTEFHPKDKLGNLLQIDDKVIYTRLQFAEVYVGTITEIISDYKVKLMPFDGITPANTVYGKLQDHNRPLQIAPSRIVKMSEAEYLEHKLKM